MDRYQFEASAELRDDPELRDDERAAVGRLADPLMLSVAAQTFQQQGNLEALGSLRALSAVERNLRPAAEHLLRARDCCPLLPRVHLHLAELLFLLESSDLDSDYLARARRLAPADPDVWFEAGLVDWQSGRADTACASWKRSLELSAQHESEILDLAAEKLSSLEALTRILPDSPERLVQLVHDRYAGPEAEAERNILLARAEDVFARRPAVSSADYYLRAVVYRAEGNTEQAIETYRQAIELAPGQTAWRYELATLLKESGRLSEALDEARWCARSDFSSTAYRGLLEEISRQLHPR